uniref:Uncharacterized protein n=1 Tax=Panagrolaimus sp. ES5 TaxID=591445 RepID=A0AC34GPT7_9BILA
MNTHWIILVFISFDFCYGEPYSVRYNAMKSSIESLLETEPGTGISKFSDGLDKINLTSLSSKDAQNTLKAWIKNVETTIIQNASIPDALTKLKKIATSMDVLFVKKPIIEDYISWQNISSWGPVSVFQFIMDEYNINDFWDVVAKDGGYRCVIYDHIFKLTKGNKVIQRNLYTTNAPCDKSIKMVLRIINLPYDFPVYERNVVKTTILPSGISINQVIRVAKLYFISKKITCGRLLHIFGNYKSANFYLLTNIKFKSTFDSLKKEFTSDKTAEYCVTRFSDEISKQIDVSEVFINYFMKVKWEKIFGSVFDNVIVHDCQIQVLKEKAPEFFSKKIVKQEL